MRRTMLAVSLERLIFPKGSAVAARPRKDFKTDDYPSRVAANLREMRLAKDWSVKDLSERLSAIGAEVPIPSLYAYERGKLNGGVDLPWELVPAIGKVFGSKPLAGWLPPK